MASVFEVERGALSFAAQAVREKLGHSLARVLQQVDVIALPTTTITAPVLSDATDADGLPIGLQIIGDAWDDALLLSVLAELERVGAARAVRSPRHVNSLGHARSEGTADEAGASPAQPNPIRRQRPA